MIFNRKQCRHYKVQPKSESVNAKNNILLLFICCLGFIQITAAQNACRNPNNKPGNCKSIYECPVFLNVLKGSPSASQRTFMAQSQCQNGSGRRPFVCCNSDIDFEVQSVTPRTTRTPPIRSTGPKLLPEPPNCGFLSLSDKIYGGNSTGLDQYTWTALLEYNIKGQRSFNCGGSLINQRYVLTAGHCLIGDEVDLKMVRLGEYNTLTEVDCVLDECNEKPVDVEVEEIIPHPDFDPFTVNRHNDIGLIRLARDITYTDFISPVCLPLSGSTPPVTTGDSVTVTGWGRTLLSRSSNVKQHLSLRVVDQNGCRQKFAAKRVTIAPTQVCAGGEFQKDACDGDSGGPLMKINGINWFIEGIVSYGYRCGLQEWPGVYTRVADYVDWIQRTVRP